MSRGEPTPEVRELLGAMLRAARQEQPTRRSLAQALMAASAASVASATAASAAALATTATGVSSAGASGAASGTLASTGAKAAATLGVGEIGKWLGMGVLAGGLTVATVDQVVDRETSASGSPVVEGTPQRVAESRGTVRLPVGPTLEPPVPEQLHQAPPPARAAFPPVAASPARARGAAPASGLSEEVALLDRARRDLERGDVASVLKQGDEYTHRFPAGALREDAAYLQMEALWRAGRQEQARAAARALLRRYPRSAHRERASAIASEEL